jgi:hypothetical protein
MSEISFKIKCDKSSSARRFSLSKPNLANLRSHVEASWGASGPSIWYVDDDGDRIEVLDDNDFQAAINQIKGSCVSLNVDFVSDQIEFKSGKIDDVASSASASSESPHDDDGFISVELHDETPVPTSSLPMIVTHVSASCGDVHDHVVGREVVHDHVAGRERLVPELHQESFGDAFVDKECKFHGQHVVDLAHHCKIATAIEEMMTSSGTGFTRDSFRAAVASSDAASLKLMIRNALLTSSCLAEVQQIAQAAMKRIERSMQNSLNAAPATAETGPEAVENLMKRLNISDMPRSELHSWLKFQASREQLSCLSALELRQLRFYAIKSARDEKRSQVLANKLERHLMNRPSAEQLKQAHIIVEPSEAHAAALERSIIAQRLESELAARNKVASRFAGCVSAAHALHDTSSAEFTQQCHREQASREQQRSQVAATIERNLAGRHSLRDLKKAHIVVAPVEARAAALERTMTAQRLEKNLSRCRVAPRHAGYTWSGGAPFAPQQDVGSIPSDCVGAEQHSEAVEPSVSWASLAGSHASSQDLQRYESCSATLESMGFHRSENLMRTIVAHNCDIDVIVQHIFG